MANTTIPTRLYVVFRPDGADNERTRLGFMSPKTDDAAFEKRRLTQHRWAYGNVEFDAAGKGTVVGHRWEHFVDGTPSRQVRETAPLQADLYPEELGNELLEGFQIAKSVRRYGWNGGNTVWRVSDPRGFELEISSANFARIVDCTTIDRGVIQGRCLWGRSGSENILLPEASDVYQEAKTWTQRVSTTVSLKELQPGDTVDLTDTNAQYNGAAVYYGRCSVVSPQATQREDLVNSMRTAAWSSSRSNYQYFHSIQFGGTSTVTERYVFKIVATGEYYAVSTPKISSRIAAVDKPLDAEAIVHELSGKPIKGKSWYSKHIPSMVYPGKLSPKNITIQLAKASKSVADEWLAKPLQEVTHSAIVQLNNEFWGVFVGREQSANGSTAYNAPYCYYAVKLNVTNTGLEAVTVDSTISNLFGGVKSRYMVRQMSADELATLDFYQVVSSHKSKTAVTDQVSAFALSSYWIFPHV